MDIFQLMGMGGAFLITFALYKLEKGHYSAKHSLYWVLNISGSLLLFASLWPGDNYGAMALQLVWIGISLRGLYHSEIFGKKVSEIRKKNLR